MCRSLSRPSHFRPFNMHCPPRAQLLAVAYLGIIRMNSFFLRKGGRTGRREGKKRRSSILNLLTKIVSFFSFPSFSARATHSSPACPRLWNPRHSALEKPVKEADWRRNLIYEKLSSSFVNHFTQNAVQQWMFILSKLRQKTGKLKHSQWYTVFTRKSTVQNKISAYVS